jgi:hypothetical protein
MSHQLEQAGDMNADQKFRFGLNLNKDLQKHTLNGENVISKQIKYWKNKVKENEVFSYLERYDADSVMENLKSNPMEDNFIYFNCHGASSTEDLDNVLGTYLYLTNDDPIFLNDLENIREKHNQFINHPLVFINACETAELTPLKYFGFVPFFTLRGACGVIGTECIVPAYFAYEWASRFFDLFLKGKPVGWIFWHLRWKFFDEKNNILGLLYATYVNADKKLSASLVN